MDAPIISPWFFYALSILETLYIFCKVYQILFATLGMTILIFCIIITIENGIEECLRYAAMSKPYVIGATIVLFMTIFVPNSTTVIKMQIANIVTPKNIEYLGETSEKVFDNIVDKIVESANKISEKEDK